MDNAPNAGISREENRLRDNAAIILWTAATFLAVAVGSHTSVFIGLVVAGAAYVAVWWFLQR